MTRGQSTPRATHFVLLFNRLPTAPTFNQLGREVRLDSGTVAIASCTEPGELCYADPHDFLAVAIDQARLRELVDRVEDLVARPLPNSPALRHLRRYLEILPMRQDAWQEPKLFAHIATALTDLVALALGAGRDAAELAKTRGLRAARQHEIIREISTRFTDPDFSAQKLARQMNVTDRYVQDLLHECGSSFSERASAVVDLRSRPGLAFSPTGDALAVIGVGSDVELWDATVFRRPPAELRASVERRYGVAGPAGGGAP